MDKNEDIERILLLRKINYTDKQLLQKYYREYVDENSADRCLSCASVINYMRKLLYNKWSNETGITLNKYEKG